MAISLKRVCVHGHSEDTWHRYGPAVSALHSFSCISVITLHEEPLQQRVRLHRVGTLLKRRPTGASCSGNAHKDALKLRAGLIAANTPLLHNSHSLMSFWDHEADEVHDVNYTESKVINAEREHRRPSTRFSTRSAVKRNVRVRQQFPGRVRLSDRKNLRPFKTNITNVMMEVWRRLEDKLWLYVHQTPDEHERRQERHLDPHNRHRVSNVSCFSLWAQPPEQHTKTQTTHSQSKRTQDHHSDVIHWSLLDNLDDYVFLINFNIFLCFKIRVACLSEPFIKLHHDNLRFKPSSYFYQVFFTDAETGWRSGAGCNHTHTHTHNATGTTCNNMNSF